MIELPRPHVVIPEERIVTQKVCTGCGHKKHHEFSHRTPEGRKMYVDNRSHYWNSGRCPPCFMKQISLAARKRRARLKEQKNDIP